MPELRHVVVQGDVGRAADLKCDDQPYIYTTRHIYHLLLRSGGRVMQHVEFYYPDEILAAMKEADRAAAKRSAVDPPTDQNATGVVKSAAVDPAQFNFSYTIDGANVPF